MELKEHLTVLAKRESSKLGNVLAAYEVKKWPDGRIDELDEMGMLISIPDATTIKCPCCSKGCSVEPVKGIANDGTEFCEVLCEKEGSSDVEPFYLKQWQITEKIRKYLPKTKKKLEDAPPADYIIKQQGGQFILTYKGNDEILPKTLGSKYIVYLLTHKDKDISAIQLEMECALKPTDRPADPDDVSEGLGVIEHAGDLGNLADFKPAQMQSAIELLEQKIEDTDKQAEKGHYQSQLDLMHKYMSGSKNVYGTNRKTGAPLEKARCRVTPAINTVKRKIQDKQLKAHLKSYIKTGSYLSYKPDDAVFWDIS